MKKKTAVVVLSGGQDSGTCLALATSQYENVHTITFHYGQKHEVELECAAGLAKLFAVRSHRVVDVTMLRGLVTSALIGTAGATTVNDAHPNKKDLPASFVPVRNALFLTLAHGLAQEVGAEAVVTGVCQTDYSGYPDCRKSFTRSLEHALNTGYQSEIRIETPLMFASKADTFAVAQELGVLQTIIEFTHTCYNGVRDPEHRWPWGYGCGSCPACQLRRKGYQDFLAGRNMLSPEELHAWTEGHAMRDPNTAYEELVEKLCPPITALKGEPQE